MEEGVRDPDQNEVRAHQEKYEFVEKYSLACATDDELENQQNGDRPLDHQNNHQCKGLIFNDAGDDPIKERGRYHAEGGQYDVNGDEDYPAEGGQPIQSQFKHGNYPTIYNM